jgi:quercetin dioxygenase-like cupin family protein
MSGNPKPAGPINVRIGSWPVVATTIRPVRAAARRGYIGRNVSMRRLDRSSGLGLVLTVLAIALGGGTLAWHGAFAPPAAGNEGAKITPAFTYDLPHLPGQKVTGVLVEYGPGGGSPPHHHTTEGSVVAYVLDGAIRSKVNDGPVTVYQAGESWLEPPGAAHSVSENASAAEPARLLAVFVAEAGAELTTFDQ